jgi:atypical dual specificity phosphatase
VDWTRVDDHVIASSYPFEEAHVRALVAEGVTLLINLHEEAHDPERLSRAGISELHVPVGDLRSPRPEQIDEALSAMAIEAARGRSVAVHCAYGVGRTGTIVACWFVRSGLTADEAIARIRELRPGSVEMPSQERAVHAFAARFPR